MSQLRPRRNFVPAAVLRQLDPEENLAAWLLGCLVRDAGTHLCICSSLVLLDSRQLSGQLSATDKVCHNREILESYAALCERQISGLCQRRTKALLLRISISA